MSLPTFVATRTDEQRAAIRFLAAYTRTLRTMAGEDFSWLDENGKHIGHEPARHNPTYGNARAGYRAIVWTRQDGLCATCGEAMALAEFDICHFVGNGGSKGKVAGHVDFNTFGAHPWCNILDAEDHGDVIPARCLARPEFLMHTYPTRADMLAADRTEVAKQSSTMAQYRVERMARIAALLAAE